MLEYLTDKIQVHVSKDHTFGSDALQLSHFVKAHCPKAKNICDLGTGCGIIPLSLAALRVGESITGIDIQAPAISLFQDGIDASDTPCTLVGIIGDFTQKNILSSSTYDLVVANPPYFKVGNGILPPNYCRAVARYEIACDVDKLFAVARRITTPAGCICVCYPPNRLAHVLRAMEDNRFSPRYLQFVSKSPEESPWLFLLMGQKGVGDQLVVRPTIYHETQEPKEVFFP